MGEEGRLSRETGNSGRCPGPARGNAETGADAARAHFVPPHCLQHQPLLWISRRRRRNQLRPHRPECPHSHHSHTWDNSVPLSGLFH